MVFVLDAHKNPFMPCAEKRIRQLLERGRAVIPTWAPFTIRLQDRAAKDSAFQPLRIQFDPGSPTTGDWRGPKVRRSSASGKPPSSLAWMPGVLCAEGCGIGRRATVRPGFQTASGKRDGCRPRWQPGWIRRCMRGSRSKSAGPRTATEFGYPDIQGQAQKPLRDAAMMNTPRWRLYEQLKAIGLPIEGGSGGCTKPQRLEHSFPQEHYFAALCVGESTPAHFTHLPAQVQRWTAKGRGTRQLGGPDAYGFPIRHRARQQGYFGFQTGDLVRAVVPTGKYAGSHTGRVLVRSSGRVDITTDGRRVAQGIAYKPCRILQRNGGWVYEQKPVSA